MGKLTDWLDRTFYRGVEDNWDDGLFRDRILAVAGKDVDVLDLGAGAGIVHEMNFKGCFRRVCGVDPDERVLQNPYLDEAKVGTGERIPYPDHSFDLVIADNVLEHLAQPGLVFGEVARVLKPNGMFLFKTPNRYHYMPLIARLTPTSFHRWVNRLRGRKVEDTFPTCYRANSRSQIRLLSTAAGFEIVNLALVEGRPEYLRMTFATYLVGIVYERLVNAISLLMVFRILLVGELKVAGR